MPAVGDISVADLVEMRQLELRVLAGEGGLSRRVSWTHVCELEDPGPWLDGGELLIANGFGIPASSVEQVRYVTRLSQYRVSALALGGHAPDLSNEMLRAAEELDFPILRVPREVPFVSISHLVANANLRTAQRRLMREIRLFDTLRLRNGRRAPREELFADLERISGYQLALVSAAGCPLLTEWPWVPQGLSLAGHARHPSDILIVDGGYAVPVFVEERVAAFLIGIMEPGSNPAGLSDLRHIATIAALEVVADAQRREDRRRSGADLLADLLAGRLAAKRAGEMLAAQSLDLGRSTVLLVLRSPEGGVLDPKGIHHWLADRRVPHLLLEADELYVLTTDDPHRLDGLVSDLEVFAGVSARISEPGQLVRARREALWASVMACRRKGQKTVRFDSNDRLAHWLPADVDALAHMVKSTLAPIIDYDSSHQTDLVGTLDAFFRNQRKVRSTAAELFVHEHTLTYRLQRIEQITHRDLNDVYDAFELWLALEARALMQDQFIARP